MLRPYGAFDIGLCPRIAPARVTNNDRDGSRRETKKSRGSELSKYVNASPPADDRSQKLDCGK